MLAALGCIASAEVRSATAAAEAGGVCRISLSCLDDFLDFAVVFDVETREERTEVRALPFCASIELSETFLRGLFDGDTDDLHGWCITVVRITRWDGH